MTGWRHEHGDVYDVPTEILRVEGIEDLSWHNDTCPSFGAQIGVGGDLLRLRIWVDHPDPDQRDMGWPRFYVVGESWNDDGAAILDAAGVPDSHGDNDEGVHTDDVAVAVVTFLSYLARVHCARIAHERNAA